MNLSMPWQMKEDLIRIAKDRHASLASTIRDAIRDGLKPELQEIERERVLEAREATR